MSSSNNKTRKTSKKFPARASQQPKTQARPRSSQIKTQPKKKTKFMKISRPIVNNEYKIVNVPCKIPSAKNVPKKTTKNEWDLRNQKLKKEWELKNQKVIKNEWELRNQKLKKEWELKNQKVIKNEWELKNQIYRQRQQEIRERYSPRKMKEIYVNPNKNKMFRDDDEPREDTKSIYLYGNKQELNEIKQLKAKSKSDQDRPQVLILQHNRQEPIETIPPKSKNKLDQDRPQEVTKDENIKIEPEPVQTKENWEKPLFSVKQTPEMPKTLTEVEEKANHLISEAHKMIWCWLFNGIFPNAANFMEK